MDPIVDSIRTDLDSGSWLDRVEGARRAAALIASGAVSAEHEVLLCEALLNCATDKKWEVRKAAAQALGEARHSNLTALRSQLDLLATDLNPWVRTAAHSARRTLTERAKSLPGWQSVTPSPDPVPEYIATKIKALGPSPLTPAGLYDLIMELGEEFYRQLAADMEHEINTLLTPIRGYLEVIEDRVAGVDADAVRYVRSAAKRLGQVDKLIEQLDVYSAPPETHFAPAALRDLVLEAQRVAVEMVARDVLAEKVGEITFNIEAPDDVMAEVLPEALRRAVTNIVSNALYAMEGTGVLTVRLLSRGDGRAEIVVSDTGPGMTREELDAAQLRFRSTRKDRGGTGLGLPIARRIIQRDHGGEFAIESTPGQGTIVRMIVPVRRPARAEQ
jgi:signal transduction histidine kinase